MDPVVPIAGYALLGDGRTAALVSRGGSIDWLCWPDFDSPSLFARLLDVNRGGSFSIGPAGAGGIAAKSRRYLPGTNILETTFECASGSATVTDFLAVDLTHDGVEDITSKRALVRLVRGIDGRSELALTCAPRPDYAARRPTWKPLSPRAVVLEGASEPLLLCASVPLVIEGDAVVARIDVGRDEDAWVLLAGEEAEIPDGLGYGRHLFDDTARYWRSWLHRLDYRGPFAREVERSALVLKTLIYAPTGALIAAPTTSLPEVPGGVRNWDYRFSWVRDATLSLAALHGIGYSEEARRFFRFLFDTARARDPASLSMLYTIRGAPDAPERELDLAGYGGARPVRVGNAAAGQVQLDAWGELVDSLFTFRDHLGARFEDLAACFAYVDWVAANWRRRDQSLWEMRDRGRPFVHSRVMCWVALDRGIRLATSVLRPEGAGPFFAGHAERCRAAGGLLPCEREIDRWIEEREAIRAEVLARGYDATLGAFVQASDHRVLDASLLRMPLVGFIDATDPRMVSTIERIHAALGRRGQVYRYRAGDGLPGDEHAFPLCTFWLVEALQLLGRDDEALDLYRRTLAFANDVGLLSEELDPLEGSLWGNFPQAFTHLGVLRCAVRFERGRLRPPSLSTAAEDAPVEEWVGGAVGA